MHRSPNHPDPRTSRHPSASSRPERASRLEGVMDRVRAGDDAAFTNLYRALAPEIYALLFDLGREPGLAEDLTRETFARMYRDRAAYAPGAGLASWALSIARRLFADHARRPAERAPTWPWIAVAGARNRHAIAGSAAASAA